MEIKKLYRNRFSEKEYNQRYNIWKVLCNSFFQKYVPEDSTVADVGAGYCEFINNIRCAKKYAIDINEDTIRFANSDVKTLNTLSVFPSDSIDIVFMSNFLEHLKTKEDIVQILSEAFRVLKPGTGKIMLLQPNIRYLYKGYWDFFDHYTPLSDRSIVEVLQLVGFKIETVIPKFLPYSTAKLPRNLFLVKAYLKLPFAWKILGKHMFVIARKI